MEPTGYCRRLVTARRWVCNARVTGGEASRRSNNNRDGSYESVDRIAQHLAGVLRRLVDLETRREGDGYVERACAVSLCLVRAIAAGRHCSSSNERKSD
jgi:hypothetical protein